MPWVYCHFKFFKSFLLLCTCMLLGVVHMCHGLHVGIRRQLCTWFSPCSSSWVLGLNLGCHTCSTGGFSAEPSHYCLVTTRSLGMTALSTMYSWCWVLGEVSILHVPSPFSRMSICGVFPSPKLSLTEPRGILWKAFTSYF